MNILLIHPSAPPTLESMSEGLQWWRVRARNAPLELARLVTLTSSEHKVHAIDQGIHSEVPFDSGADLAVCVVTEPGQVPGLRYLSGRFQTHKLPMVVCGSFVSAHPERMDMADVILTGPPESTWSTFLEDWAAGRRSTARVGRALHWSAPPLESLAESPIVRWESLNPGAYYVVPVEVCRMSGWTAVDALEQGRPQVLYRSVARVAEEIERLVRQGVKRIRLAGPDLLADPIKSEALLAALTQLLRAHRALRFEARVAIQRLHLTALLDRLPAAGVRRIDLELNHPQLMAADPTEDFARTREAVRTLHERGVRVVGTLTLGRLADDTATRAHQEAFLRESGATPFVRAARILPSTPEHAALKAAGHALSSMRDADLRAEIFDVPNYPLDGLSRDAAAEWLKSLVLDATALVSIERRLRALYVEAARGPHGPLLDPSDLVACARMLAGSLSYPQEQRVAQVVRFLLLTAALRPSPTLWTQALEQLLEEAALRSLVIKTAHGLPLEHTLPVLSVKQRLLGMGARLAGRFRPAPGSTSV